MPITEQSQCEFTFLRVESAMVRLYSTDCRWRRLRGHLIDKVNKAWTTQAITPDGYTPCVTQAITPDGLYTPKKPFKLCTE